MIQHFPSLFFLFLILQRNFFLHWLRNQTSATKLCYLRSSAFHRQPLLGSNVIWDGLNTTKLLINPIPCHLFFLGHFSTRKKNVLTGKQCLHDKRDSNDLMVLCQLHRIDNKQHQPPVLVLNKVPQAETTQTSGQESMPRTNVFKYVFHVKLRILSP